MKKLLSLFLVLAFVMAPVAFASDNDLAYLGFNELDSITTAETGDKTPVYDSSTDTVKAMDASNPAVAGDVTFRTSLLAAGRVNAASTVASSSTQLAPSSLPYVVLRKYAGGNNSLDETDGGTRLQNGTSGQVLVLILQEVDTDGSWIVTPETSLTISSLTFDAQGETTTLLYVDDTIGWIYIANYGTTISLKKQSGIPPRP